MLMKPNVPSDYAVLGNLLNPLLETSSASSVGTSTPHLDKALKYCDGPSGLNRGLRERLTVNEPLAAP
jgi:hypothetical protein